MTPDAPGSTGQRLVARAAPVLDIVLGLRCLARMYSEAPDGCTPEAFMRWSLDRLNMRVKVTDGDLERFPQAGPAVVVANHPFGGIEGMVLGLLLRWVRQDVKILANYMLGRISEIRDTMILIDPFGSTDAARKNLAPLRDAMRWVTGGGMLGVFPAGEVAHMSLRRMKVVDPPWSEAVGRIIRRGRCPVIPVYFRGRNSALFQTVGLVHPALRTLMLARELLHHRGSVIEVRIGSPIPYSRLSGFETANEIVSYLRDRTEILGVRSEMNVPSTVDPVQPRVTPSEVKSIVPPVPVGVLEEEIGALSPDHCMVENNEEQVFVARAEEIPSILREIGRLREVTFREVGEGTGREIDIDRFDTDYLHLFVWNRSSRELVGAYRLGCTDELLRRQGQGGLYTATLFEFRKRVFEHMGPALEMGRSWIRPEYQKSYAGLVLLWKGIGQYVIRNPRYATLFGPVSISADYTSASQRLMVAFLKQNRYAHGWSRWVRPRRPFRALPTRSHRPRFAHLQTLEDVSTFISEIEADQKGVPILLRQYLKLGGRLLGFNVDPNFGNVLDVLIMVDLRKTERKILNRYMGREGVQRFLAHHPDARNSIRVS